MRQRDRWLLGAFVALAAANIGAQDNAAVVRGSVAEGVELTKRAQVSTNIVEKQASLQQAEAIYTNVLKADPKQGAALNNLAVLAAGKGDGARLFIAMSGSVQGAAAR